MEYLGTKKGSNSIATMANAGGGNVYVTTFGVPTYLSWVSGDDALKIHGCSALMSGDELRFFRYKRRRNGGDCGRARHHGWHDCTEYFSTSERFIIEGSGDEREIKKEKIDSLGLRVRTTPAEYEKTKKKDALSLSYRCAFAIFRNGRRVSDMMHFSVTKSGVYGSW